MAPYREHARHLDREFVLAMLLYCVLLAGGLYALVYAPSPKAVPSMAMIEVPAEHARDETVGYR